MCKQAADAPLAGGRPEPPRLFATRLPIQLLGRDNGRRMAGTAPRSPFAAFLVDLLGTTTEVASSFSCQREKRSQCGWLLARLCLESHVEAARGNGGASVESDCHFGELLVNARLGAGLSVSSICGCLALASMRPTTDNVRQGRPRLALVVMSSRGLMPGLVASGERSHRGSGLWCCTAL